MKSIVIILTFCAIAIICTITSLKTGNVVTGAAAAFAMLGAGATAIISEID